MPGEGGDDAEFEMVATAAAAGATGDAGATGENGGAGGAESLELDAGSWTNILVDRVLDWELAYVGDPIRELRRR